MPDLTEPVQADDHTRGAPDADLELVMYGDFECPFCAAAQSILARVEKRLGERLRFVFRHFPLEAVHPHARHAAEAAEAVAAAGRFWEFHDVLFASQGRLTDADLVAHARRLGVDIEAELRDRVHAAAVEHDIATGAASGVTGTPAFFANGQRIEGAFDASSIVEALTASTT